MGNKCILRKSNKPQNQNYKLRFKSNPKQNQPSPQTNSILQTKTSFIQPHLFKTKKGEHRLKGANKGINSR